jgi:5-methyltetrahydropteroyltriglutamate--homocysteine methyltransferase
MKNSSSRILTTHVGSLVRPPDLMETLRAKESGQSYDPDVLVSQVRRAVKEVVRQQAEVGIDIPSDGEYSKPNFSGYVNERLAGFERRPREPNESPSLNWGRDRKAFLAFYEAYEGSAQSVPAHPVVCTGPIAYTGQAAVQRDIENFRSALEGVDIEEAFIPAVASSTIEAQRRNEYYATENDYLYAIADAMKEEYNAIVDAGFLLQIDDPRIVVQYDMIDPAPSVEAFRRSAELRVDVINHALQGIPPERVRYHLCWGSWHGPHTTDFPLKDIIDIVLKINAGAYAIEAANPRHEHEFRVWEEVKLPDDKLLIPGVVAHTTNTVEHPELVAWRISNFARLVDRENVIASTDCGFSQGAFVPRVHASIMWAKLRTLAEGAALATQQLWG